MSGAEPTGFVCAQCQSSLSQERAQPGVWFACESAWCDWVQIRTFRGQLEFCSEADARTNFRCAERRDDRDDGP
jgi:hypothetical protein